MGVCEDFLPEGLKLGAGAIGVESGGDGVGDAVEDEGFAKLEPVGEVLANFFVSGHNALWVKRYFYGMGWGRLMGGRKSVGFLRLEDFLSLNLGLLASLI